MSAASVLFAARPCVATSPRPHAASGGVGIRNERRSKEQLKAIMGDNVIITSMVVLFMLYPAVSTQTFEMFSCKSLCK